MNSKGKQLAVVLCSSNHHIPDRHRRNGYVIDIRHIVVVERIIQPIIDNLPIPFKDTVNERRAILLRCGEERDGAVGLTRHYIRRAASKEVRLQEVKCIIVDMLVPREDDVLVFKLFTAILVRNHQLERSQCKIMGNHVLLHDGAQFIERAYSGTIRIEPRGVSSLPIKKDIHLDMIFILVGFYSKRLRQGRREGISIKT